MSRYAMALSGPRVTGGLNSLVRTTEVSMAALVVSMASARLGGAAGKHVAGFPLELVSAAGFLAASAMGAGGPRLSGDLMNFADGCLAAYMANQGRELGTKAAASGYEIGSAESDYLRSQAGLGR